MPFKDHDLNQALKNLREMEKEVERLLKDFFVSKNPMLMVSENGWTPHIDVYETEGAYIIKVEIAGVRREDVRIHMEDQVLVVSGRRVDDCEEDRKHFHLAEISYGHFVRRIELPREIDRDGIRAAFNNGMLKIYVPKAKAKESGPISIPISD
jgi:HSP20 family protein